MNDIGSNLKEARISTSLSLEEASADTEIPLEALEQIEAGSIGSFKDIFKLKEYLTTYSKYLGFDSNKVIDKFNEYLFEYTSKIPLEDLEKAMEVQEKEKKQEDTDNIKVISPYLIEHKETNFVKYVVIAVVIIILVAVTLIWAIKQVA